jgi:hypothetical protein
MRRGATISVDDDLATSKARIAIGSADFEQSGGIDEYPFLAWQPAIRHDIGEHAFDIVAQFRLAGVVRQRSRMLGRNHQRGGPHRHAAFILQCHLALGVGLEEIRGAGMTIGGHALEDLVRIIERRRHQVRSLVGRIAEHDPLIARAFVLVAALVDALRDMRGLSVQVAGEFGGLPVEAFLFIADVPHRLADNRLDLPLGLRGEMATGILDTGAADLAREHDALGRGKGFAGDARFRILGQEQIYDGVGNLIADLVGMTFGHRFGREKIVAAHHKLSSLGRNSDIRISLYAGH